MKHGALIKKKKKQTYFHKYLTKKGDIPQT